jgi:hypothetical protein
VASSLHVHLICLLRQHPPSPSGLGQFDLFDVASDFHPYIDAIAAVKQTVTEEALVKIRFLLLLGRQRPCAWSFPTVVVLSVRLVRQLKPSRFLARLTPCYWPSDGSVLRPAIRLGVTFCSMQSRTPARMIHFFE